MNFSVICEKKGEGERDRKAQTETKGTQKMEERARRKQTRLAPKYHLRNRERVRIGR